MAEQSKRKSIYTNWAAYARELPWVDAAYKWLDTRGKRKLDTLVAAYAVWQEREKLPKYLREIVSDLTLLQAVAEIYRCKDGDPERVKEVIEGLPPDTEPDRKWSYKMTLCFWPNDINQMQLYDVMEGMTNRERVLFLAEIVREYCRAGKDITYIRIEALTILDSLQALYAAKEASPLLQGITDIMGIQYDPETLPKSVIPTADALRAQEAATQKIIKAIEWRREDN